MNKDFSKMAWAGKRHGYTILKDVDINGNGSGKIYIHLLDDETDQWVEANTIEGAVKIVDFHLENA